MVAVLEIATRRFPSVLIASVASAALLVVGCATPTPQSEWKPAGYYITDQTVYGCDSFEGAKGTVMKKTALVSLSLQRKLLGLLEHAASADKDLLSELDDHRDKLLCWFETPEKDIELSLGEHCDSPFLITFHPRGEEWLVTGASSSIVLCHGR